MNYYDILGVDRNATDKEIKDAFNNMIKAFHPDLYRGKDKEFANKKTRELYEAYNVLKNSDKKREYDRYLDSIEKGVNYNNSYYDSSQEASYAYSYEYNNDNNGHSDNEQHSTDSGTADATQSMFSSNKKGIIVAVVLIAIFAGFFIIKSLGAKNEVTFKGTYIYNYYEAYNSNQELIETGTAEEDGIFNKFVIHSDGTVESYYEDSYAEGTWTVSDDAPENMVMLALNLSGDNEASLFDFLAINEKRNFAVYAFNYEEETLFVYFDRAET